MGFISNQWLNRGQGRRNRKHSPIPITAITSLSTDAWSKRNAAVAEITALRADSQFQALYLSRTEVEQAVAIMVNLCGPQARTRLVLEILRQMEDSEFLRILASDLKTRISS